MRKATKKRKKRAKDKEKVETEDFWYFLFMTSLNDGQSKKFISGLLNVYQLIVNLNYTKTLSIFHNKAILFTYLNSIRIHGCDLLNTQFVLSCARNSESVKRWRQSGFYIE